LNAPTFSTLPLHHDVLNNLTSLGYTEMTPIQRQSLPHVLQGKDVIGQAKTGSGKTAVFGLGLLNRLNIETLHIQGVVLCPTRELADQVTKELRKLARSLANIKIITLAGGLPFKAQATSLAYGAHIVVGTPGRMVDHLERGHLELKHVKIWVLD